MPNTYRTTTIVYHKNNNPHVVRMSCSFLVNKRSAGQSYTRTLLCTPRTHAHHHPERVHMPFTRPRARMSTASKHRCHLRRPPMHPPCTRRRGKAALQLRQQSSHGADICTALGHRDASQVHEGWRRKDTCEQGKET